MKVTLISKADFVSLLHDVDTDPEGWAARHSLPIIVDFYAEWCGPCKALAPHLDALAEEYDGRIEIYKVDIDQDEELTALYNIRTVPTLLFARPSDTKPRTMLGVMGRAELREKIEQLLLG
ncbi:co-chaperone YbbN [Porphyromonas sp. COT-239 OH1446]|uniref:thioredoxin family protein n=1 Tax=Porphyromonas sp. COT-239 OH1446 TaxID=1515613 RepID=UPI00052C2D5E|nr:thioredoxin domain-containing protein [Porphyromonas sp. COT-239 OH1446]KGN69984.1 hypothetical protein HQ37_05030 [Porphyromonas sp. COT-239 OH1446]